MSQAWTPALPRIPVHALWGPFTTCLGPKLPQNPQKRPKSPFFHLRSLIAWPPGGRSKNQERHAFGLGLKISPAKFHPNPSTYMKFRHEKLTNGGVPYSNLGVASRVAPLLSARTALKKGTTSLRSVVNKILPLPCY